MTTADRINAALADEARSTLRTRIDLDAFLALSADERGARWRQFDHSAKWQLVALAIVRQTGRDWTTEEVEQSIAHWDAKWEAGRPDSDLTIPPAADICARAKEEAELARRRGDAVTAARLSRVRMNVLSGARLKWHQGDLLVNSVNTPSAVYTVSAHGCTCPATKPCWHQQLVELLIDMQDDAAGDADLEADADDPLPPPWRIGAFIGRRLALARARYLEAA